MSGVYLALLEATGGHGLAKVAIYSPMQPRRVAMASHRELICMHSGIVNRNRSPGRGPLLLSIQALPGHATGRAHCLRCPRSARNKPHGQAVAGSIG
eukprot:COSAG01_NODE_2959_length_6793_cov_16.043771_7_plen_96_part_01